MSTMDKDKKSLWRPPVNRTREQMIVEIMDELNKDALDPLSKHNVLDACIDRAFQAMFPEKKIRVKRKAYIKIDF